MEVSQQKSDTSKNTFNDCLISNVDTNMSENSSSFWTSNNILENGNTDSKDKCIYTVKNTELPIHDNVVISSFDGINNNSSCTNNATTEIPFNSLNDSKDLRSAITSTVDDMLNILLNSDDKTGKSEKLSSHTKVVLSSSEICEQIINSLKPRDLDPDKIESFDKFECDQNHTFDELHANAMQLSKNFIFENECPQPAELEINMVNDSMDLINKEIGIQKPLDKLESDRNRTFDELANAMQLSKNLSFENLCSQPTELKTNIVNNSMNLNEKEMSAQKPLDNLKSDKNYDFKELELNANSIQLSTDVNIVSLEKECVLPTELKTIKVPEKKSLSSYRYEYDSWSEDDESSSSSSSSSSYSSDTSSDSDFFQKVVESSSGPKIIPEIKTKGELGLDDLPPIEELSIEIPKEDMVLIGEIHAIVEKLVVVHAVKDMKPLDIDSVLFLDHDRPLGRVYDVFGPVVEPFYCIRFNSIEQINEKIIEIGANVFFAPEKNDITSYVFVDELQKEKGSDASWKFNNEPPEECLDFSDDEQEKEARRKRMNKNRNRQFSNSFDVSAKRPSLVTVTNTSDPQQNFRGRPTTSVFSSPRSNINLPAATRFSPFSSSRPFYPPQSPSPSTVRAQKFAPFSMYPPHPPPLPSPSVIEVEVFTQFSNGYPSQPPPSPSTSVVAAQRFSPFPNTIPSHPPSPPVFPAQRYVPFSNPLPPPPTAPRFTPFSNSYVSPPPPSPVFAPSRFTPPCNSNPHPPPTSPVIPPSRFNPFSSQYPTPPPPSPSPSVAAPTFNQFSSPYSTHALPPPSPSFSPSNLGVYAQPNLPRQYAPQVALERHPISTSYVQSHSVNHTMLSSQQCTAQIISPHQQFSYSPQTAIQRPVLPSQHAFGQVTLMSSLPSPASITPPVNPWNKYTYEPM